jgi:hypothetical protein
MVLRPILKRFGAIVGLSVISRTFIRVFWRKKWKIEIVKYRCALEVFIVYASVEIFRSFAARNYLGIRSVEIFTSENHGFNRQQYDFIILHMQILKLFLIDYIKLFRINVYSLNPIFIANMYSEDHISSDFFFFFLIENKCNKFISVFQTFYGFV